MKKVFRAIISFIDDMAQMHMEAEISNAGKCKCGCKRSIRHGGDWGPM